jgi:flagellar hook-basal body complex protein FliE
MALVDSVSSIAASSYAKLPDTIKPEGLAANSLLTQSGESVAAKAPGADFEGMFKNMIESVDEKQAQAGQMTRDVLLGDKDQLHQSVIAMQEASVAFSLMVEVRNKLVDSYQELMRMPV